MTIEVMKRIPANNEGKLGEMRLIVTGTAMFLYVKGYGRWETVMMHNPATALQKDRNERTALQKKIRKVIVLDESSAADHGKGVISGGGMDHTPGVEETHPTP